MAIINRDIILKDVEVPSSISQGDFVKIDGVGAYTIVLAPTFINYLPPIIEIKDGNAFEVRRRQTVDDIIYLYTLDD